jgi:hypothetical protein
MDDGPTQTVPPDGGMLSVTERNRGKMDANGVGSLNRQNTIALAKRLIANVKAGTGTLADGVLEVDTATYNDPVLFEKERRAIFDRLPFIAGLSRDLEKPGRLPEHQRIRHPDPGHAQQAGRRQSLRQFLPPSRLGPGILPARPIPGRLQLPVSWLEL